MDREYEILIEELGQFFEIPDLRPDEAEQTCLIRLANGIEFFIEPDTVNGSILVASTVAELPAGPYGKDLLELALKANDKAQLYQGTFALDTENNRLIFFQRFTSANLSGDRLGEHIILLSSTAQKWQEAMKRGELPQIHTAATSGMGIFGLRP